jgi:beta-alanine--pyruvate transaminase
MTGPDHVPEFGHGYTYSGHPVAVAAALATLDIYDEEDLLTRAAELEDDWADALHSLKGLPNVVDIRNYGLVGAIELAPRAGEPGKRAFEAFLAAYQRGLLIRVTGEIIALSPPLVVQKDQIGEIADHLRTVISALK